MKPPRRAREGLICPDIAKSPAVLPVALARPSEGADITAHQGRAWA
jgi:hypothetical protein